MEDVCILRTYELIMELSRSVELEPLELTESYGTALIWCCSLVSTASTPAGRPCVLAMLIRLLAGLSAGVASLPQAGN
jgi:hypothetical protein